MAKSCIPRLSTSFNEGRELAVGVAPGHAEGGLQFQVAELAAGHKG